MKPESLFRKQVVAFLRTLPFCKILSIQQKAITGHPDIILCLDRLFVALEIKTDIGKPSARQVLILEEIIKAKGVALIVRPSNFEVVKEILLKISKGIRYDSNELQGLTTPTPSKRIGQDRKHANEPSKKLRSKQTSVGDSQEHQQCSEGELGSVGEFREI